MGTTITIIPTKSVLFTRRKRRNTDQCISGWAGFILVVIVTILLLVSMTIVDYRYSSSSSSDTGRTNSGSKGRGYVMGGG